MTPFGKPTVSAFIISSSSLWLVGDIVFAAWICLLLSLEWVGTWLLKFSHRLLAARDDEKVAMETVRDNHSSTRPISGGSNISLLADEDDRGVITELGVEPGFLPGGRSWSIYHVHFRRLHTWNSFRKRLISTHVNCKWDRAREMPSTVSEVRWGRLDQISCITWCLDIRRNLGFFFHTSLGLIHHCHDAGRWNFSFRAPKSVAVALQENLD